MIELLNEPEIKSYKYVELEKKRQQIEFRRYIQWKSPGDFIKDKIGTDIWVLREWISSMFTDEMNWGNYGKIWVIDHIVPMRMFDLFNEKDLFICWNYRNLMPLLYEDNLKKQGNVFFAFELLYEKRNKDIIYKKLFERILPEVEWMAKYIDNYDKMK